MLNKPVIKVDWNPAYDMGQTSSKIFPSRHLSINIGCRAIENLLKDSTLNIATTTINILTNPWPIRFVPNKIASYKFWSVEVPKIERSYNVYKTGGPEKTDHRLAFLPREKGMECTVLDGRLPAGMQAISAQILSKDALNLLAQRDQNLTNCIG